MEMSELIAYAGEKYHIEEQHKWAEFPGYSVLCHPRTGKWVALLMRQWDTETGTTIERCDLKCGRQSLSRWNRPYLSEPLRMRGGNWISVAFDAQTEPEVIFRLFDQAVRSAEGQGATIILESPGLPGSARPTLVRAGGNVYRDTALPLPAGRPKPEQEVLPERLRKMRHLYEYGRESMEAKAKNFCRQGLFMQDYEDDTPWTGDFFCYFPTYQELNVKQLRGYFGWRTRLRRGEFLPIAVSAVYIYIYELLNGIGAASPEDSLQKMKDFETGYLDSGVAGSAAAGIRQNLHRWMMEFAVIHDMPVETARQYADPGILEADAALAVLRSPEEHTDEEVFSALCRMGSGKTEKSPVITGEKTRGMHLFSDAWRRAASGYRFRNRDLFTLCFGERILRPWHPLGNAVYYWKKRPERREYILSESRIFRCRDGIWQTESYEKIGADRTWILDFMHETDRRLRCYLKTGRYLKERPADAWASPFIDAVIEADQEALREAARPKITIDFTGLDRIRKDALYTRDSLLTEEERAELERLGEEEKDAATEPERLDEETEAAGPEDPDEENASTEVSLPEIPLDPLHLRVLRALLRGGSAGEIIREEHRLPSVVADAINEALYDEIGDIVVICEEDELSLVEDYREDLVQLLGGMTG